VAVGAYLHPVEALASEEAAEGAGLKRTALLGVLAGGVGCHDWSGLAELFKKPYL